MRLVSSHRALYGSLLLALSCVACGDAAEAEAELARLDQPVLRGHAARAAEQWGTVAVLAYAKDRAWGCSGTLIAPKVVVTAAHCVLDESSHQALAPESFEVIAGAANLRDYDAAESYSVEHVAAHEHALEGPRSSDPTGLGLFNDIAIIETSRPVTQLKPVELLPMHRVDELIEPGAPLIIAGFGSRLVNAAGESEGSGLHYVGALTWARRSAGEFLAGDDTESDTCPGDSGGPVYFPHGDHVYLVGSTSRGRSDFAGVDCGKGGIYTLVPAYADWIATHTHAEVDVPHDQADIDAAGVAYSAALGDGASIESDRLWAEASGVAAGCSVRASQGGRPGSLGCGLIAAVALVFSRRLRSRHGVASGVVTTRS